MSLYGHLADFQRRRERGERAFSAKTSENFLAHNRKASAMGTSAADAAKKLDVIRVQPGLSGETSFVRAL